jgi:glycine/D-amino acid oxidase-like deaminating enzyme
MREYAVWQDRLDEAARARLDPGGEAFVRTPDVLVVGGGVLGVATAFMCGRAGIGSVLLVEAESLGAGPSGAAAGLLVPDAHHGTDPPAFVELLRRGLEGWRELHELARGGVGLVELDWLLLDEHAPGPAARSSVGPPPAVPPAPAPGVPPGAERLDRDDVRRLVPGLAAEGGGLLLPRQGRLDPLAALARLAEEVRVATGVRAGAVSVRAGRVVAVETTAGRVSPGAVVFATGAPPALPGLDLELPADAVRGHLVVSEPVPAPPAVGVSPLVVALEEGGVLAGGTLEGPGLPPEVDPAVVDRVAEELAAAFPALSGVPFSHAWSCFRPAHPDRLPVVDRVPGLGNAWVTSGHYRTGLLAAPAVGRALAACIETGESPPEVAGLGVGRLMAG